MKKLFLIFIFLSFHLFNAQTNWEDITPPNFTFNSNGNLKVLDADTVFVIADNGRFFKTTDGGQTWYSNMLYDYAIPQDFYAIDFSDGQNGTVAGQNGIFLTHDGGQSWRSAYLPNYRPVYGMDMIDVNKVWAVGANGYIIHSEDGGQTWTSIDNLTTEDLSSVGFFDQNKGVILGKNGTFLKTTDGGQTWQTINIQDITDEDLWGISIHGQRAEFITGYFSVNQSTGMSTILSVDGGDTWGLNYAYPMCANSTFASITLTDNPYKSFLIDFTNSFDSESIYCYGPNPYYSGYFDPNRISYNGKIEAFDENIIYAMSGTQVLKTDNGGVYGVDKNILKTFKIYPIPATDFITIESNDDVINYIQIFSLSGREILTKNIRQNYGKIKLQNLEKGIYLLKINTEKGNFVKKITID